MRTAEEVLIKWYKPLYGIGSLEDIILTEAMKEYAYEVAKESLKNASDNFDIEDIEVSEGGILIYERIQHNILSETNIPELK